MKEQAPQLIKECEKTTSIWNGYVGLPRYGEMFSSQLGSGYSASNMLWLITPYGTGVFAVSDGGCSYYSLAYHYAVRPSINLKSEILIESGSGTKQDPFVVGLPSS